MATTPLTVHAFDQILTLFQRAASSTPSASVLGRIEVLAFTCNSEGSVMVISTNATPDIGGELVGFCPREIAGTAVSALQGMGMALVRGECGFSEPRQMDDETFIAYPMVLPPPSAPQATPFGAMLCEAVRVAPTTLIEVIPVIDPKLDLNVDTASLSLRTSCNPEPIPARNADELVAVTNLMQGSIEAAVDALLGGSGTEGGDDHWLIDGIDPTTFTPFDLGDPRFAPVAPYEVPGFGLLTASAAMIEIGDHHSLTPETDDSEVLVLRMSFSVGGATAAQVQVTCFAPDPWKEPLDLIDHQVDFDWLSTIADEDGVPNEYASQAGCFEFCAVARLDGLWIAPAFRDDALLAYVVKHVQSVLDGVVEEPVLLTLGMNELANGFVITEAGQGEIAWRKQAYPRVLGALPCGPVVHGLFDGHGRICREHAPWFVIPETP